MNTAELSLHAISKVCHDWCEQDNMSATQMQDMEAELEQINDLFEKNQIKSLRDREAGGQVHNQVTEE